MLYLEQAFSERSAAGQWGATNASRIEEALVQPVYPLQQKFAPVIEMSGFGLTQKSGVALLPIFDGIGSILGRLHLGKPRASRTVRCEFENFSKQPMQFSVGF
jgi:hypothetical protein